MKEGVKERKRKENGRKERSERKTKNERKKTEGKTHLTNCTQLDKNFK